MTLYEFRCAHCCIKFEAFTTRDVCPSCPMCDHQESCVYRVLTAPHLHGSANMPNG